MLRIPNPQSLRDSSFQKEPMEIAVNSLPFKGGGFWRSQKTEGCFTTECSAFSNPQPFGQLPSKGAYVMFISQKYKLLFRKVLL